MGQAAVDLPDPLEPGAAGKADDLLAQLAGEEVDRLLAEAELGDPAPAPPAPAEPAVEPSPAASAPADVPPAPAKPQKVEAAAPEVSKSDDLSTTIDRLAAASPTAGLRADAEATSTEVSAGGAKAAAAPAEAASRADEVAAELAADEALHGKSTIGELDRDKTDSDDAPDTSLPIYFRWLEWTILPDAIREGMGKIALLTLFNAIAVILYVLIFRKHGH